MATRSPSVLRRILTVIVLIVGTLALSGVAVHPLVLGLDIVTGRYPSVTTATGIGACAACGLGLVAAGAILWGWPRRYEVFGVALTISGGVGTWVLLVYAREFWMYSRMPSDLAEWANVVEHGKPLLVSIFTGPIILLLGVVLIREQSKRDRHATPLEKTQGQTHHKRERTPRPSASRPKRRRVSVWLLPLLVAVYVGSYLLLSRVTARSVEVTGVCAADDGKPLPGTYTVFKFARVTFGVPRDREGDFAHNVNYGAQRLVEDTLFFVYYPLLRLDAKIFRHIHYRWYYAHHQDQYLWIY